MSKPGGKVTAGVRVSSGNEYADRKQQKQYWKKVENQHKVRNVDRHVSRSKYTPHQGEREIARRLRKQRSL